MRSKLGYDVWVRHLISASVALFSLLAAPAQLVSQVNAPPASPGFGGHAANAPPTTVPSTAHFGSSPGGAVNPPTGAVNPPTSGRPPAARSGVDGERRHHHFAPYAPPLYYGVPVPYAVDLGGTEDENEAAAQAEDQDPNYQGGPTVFDRRGSGRDSYVPPTRDASPAHPADPSNDPPAAAEPFEATTLVFKDGHKLEVENYAIIGPTLFDMTPGHARKVPLASLDLEATRQTNDDRGVTFALPIPSQAN